MNATEDDAPTDLDGPTLCHRCGDQLPAGPARRLRGHPFCAPCLELPGVDYLEETRAALRGKWDSFVWLMGVLWLMSALLQLLMIFADRLVGRSSAAGFPAQLVILAPPLLVQIGLSIGTLALWPPVRTGWVVYSMLAPLWIFAVAALFPITNIKLGPVVVASTFVLIIAVMADRSARNKLAFGLEIRDADAEKLYSSHFGNSWARAGFSLGFLSLIPGLGLIALIAIPCSIAGIRDADPEAWPPVGQKSRAIAGIVLSILGLGVTACAAWWVM